MIGATDITQAARAMDTVLAGLQTGAKLLFFGVGFEVCTFLYLVQQRLRMPDRYAAVHAP